MSSVNELLELCKVKELGPADRVEELPNGEVVLYKDGSHRYFWLKPEGKESLISVTSILGVLAKPQLIHWAWAQSRQGLDYRDTRDEAATRGTSVHAALEALAKHGTVPDLDAFPESDQGYVQALAGWWIDVEPEPIATEVIVASFRNLYAGRFDLLADIGGRRCLVDLKTAKSVRPVEMFAQVESYELASQECGHPPTDVRMIVRVGEDGKWEVAESLASAADFLAIKSAFDAQKRLEKSYKELLAA